MHQTPLPCFFTSTTPPLLEFFFTPPLAYPNLHFLRQLPLSPGLDFVYPPRFPHRYFLGLYARIFSLQISGIVTLLHFKSTTPFPRWSNPPFWSRIQPPPLCTYLKNRYASDTPPVFFFYLNYPSPPGVFLYPSSGIPHPALFCVNCSYPPD